MPFNSSIELFLLVTNIIGILDFDLTLLHISNPFLPGKLMSNNTK